MNFTTPLIVAGLVLAPATAVLAQEHHDHDHHSATAGDITITHAWARAAASGGQTLVFMEFHNEGEADELEEVHADIAVLAGIVGVSFAGGTQSLQPFDDFEIPTGDFDFDPAGVAIVLEGLTTTLAEGDTFELELIFHHAGEVHVEVEVEAANATQHSHAGHSH